MPSRLSHELRLDIAPADFRVGCDPGVVVFGSDVCFGSALFDACGSWGNGQEAAAFVRESLSSTWSTRAPPTLDLAISDTLAAVDRLPPALRDADLDYSFDGVVLLASSGLVSLACAGAHEAVLWSSGVLTTVFAARLLQDEFAGQSLTEQQRLELEGKDICVGPYLGSHCRDPFTRVRPLTIAPGDVLLVGYRRLVAQLRALAVDEWIRLSAIELQALGVRENRPAAPVMVLRG